MGYPAVNRGSGDGGTYTFLRVDPIPVPGQVYSFHFYAYQNTKDITLWLFRQIQGESNERKLRPVQKHHIDSSDYVAGLNMVSTYFDLYLILACISSTMYEINS